MEILKFGGTSVANEQNISLAINIIAKNANKKIVVVSALSGVTDALISSINKAKISKKLTRKSKCIIKFDAISFQ